MGSLTGKELPPRDAFEVAERSGRQRHSPLSRMWKMQATGSRRITLIISQPAQNVKSLAGRRPRPLLAAGAGRGNRDVCLL